MYIIHSVNKEEFEKEIQTGKYGSSSLEKCGFIHCSDLDTYYLVAPNFKQELTEKEYSELTEDEKRFYQRNLTRKGNYSLNIAAKNAGVKNFDKFHNIGYKGLYNGETVSDIAKRKKLRYREDILDNMGSDGLIAKN